MRNLCLCLCCLFLVATPFTESALAQQTPSPAFLQKISAAYNAQGHIPGSLSLTGSASWTAGSRQESGSIVETVLVDGSTSESWIFPTVSHTYIHGPVDPTGLSRVCSHTDATDTMHLVQGRNCFQGVPWFDPSFILSSVYAASCIVTDVSTEADAAQGLVRLSYTPSTAHAAVDTDLLLSQVQKGSAITITYDTQAALPRQLEFQQATDQDEGASVDIAVTFSDYRNESGFMIPHHIVRYLQRTLVLDFVITNVSVQ